LAGGLWLAESRTLIREEEEGLVFPDRTTDGPAKLVLVENCGLVREKVYRIERSIW
jgi:hypothetical protein